MMGGKAGCHFTTNASVCPSITRGTGASSDVHAIVEIIANSNGGHVMPTISADEYKMSQSQKDNGGGYCVHSFVQLRTVREFSRGSDRRALREEMP